MGYAEDIRRCGLEGVAAIERYAAQVPLGGWYASTPCEGWTLLDLVRHLHATALRYLRLGNEAAATHPAPMLFGAELAGANAEDLSALPVMDGHDHVTAFAETARELDARLPLWARLPVGTFGWHWRGPEPGVIAVEWHVHAWDLSVAVFAPPHHPRDPELVAEAWRRDIPYLGLPTLPPWRAVLVASGRTPREPEHQVATP